MPINKIYKKQVNWKDTELKNNYKTLGLPHGTPLSDTLKRYKELTEEYKQGEESAKKTTKIEEKEEAEKAESLFRQRYEEITKAKNYIVLLLSSEKKHTFGRYFFRAGGKVVSWLPNFLYGTSRMVANVFTSPKKTSKALLAVLKGPIWNAGGIQPWFDKIILPPITSMLNWNSKEFIAYLSGGSLTGTISRGFNIVGSFIHNFVHHFMKLTEAIVALTLSSRMWSYALGLLCSFIPGANAILTPIFAGIGTVSGAIALFGQFLTASLGLLLDIWDEYTQIRLRQNIKKMERRKTTSSKYMEGLKNQEKTLMENQALAEFLLYKRLWSWQAPNIVGDTYTGLKANGSEGIYQGGYNNGFGGWAKGTGKSGKAWFDVTKSSATTRWDISQGLRKNPVEDIYDLGAGVSREDFVVGIVRDKIYNQSHGTAIHTHSGIAAGKKNKIYSEKQKLKEEIERQKKLEPLEQSDQLLMRKEQPGANSLQLDPQENENPTSFNKIPSLQGKMNIYRNPHLDPVPEQENTDSKLQKEREQFIAEKIKAMKGPGIKMGLKAASLFSKVFSISKVLENPGPTVKEMNPELQDKYGKIQKMFKPHSQGKIMDRGAQTVKKVLSAIP